MMKNFIEMVEEKIEEGSLLTIGITYSGFNSLDSIVPDSINADSGIHIKGEWLNMNIPANCEISYDDFDEEYIIKYEKVTLYFS